MGLRTYEDRTVKVNPISTRKVSYYKDAKQIKQKKTNCWSSR